MISASAWSYVVRCHFEDRGVRERWIQWLVSKHAQDVLDAGALAAEVIELEEPAVAAEARYRFEDRATYERYLTEHAPRLRDEGLGAFPLTLGLRYERSAGPIVASIRQEAPPFAPKSRP